MKEINISADKGSPYHSPRVSVVMPVFNGESFLQEAIDSILNQSFQNFEFIIVDDGSIDKTNDIIKSYNDDRIILIKNGDNLGITKSLNMGIKRAAGDYIARMDADEISDPARFERQVAFLDTNKDIGVCGTLTKTIGREVESTWRYPLDHDHIRASLLFHCCLVHASVMIRNNILKINNLFYNEQFDFAQDYEFWVRLSKITRITNIDEILIRYRMHNNSIGAKHNAKQLKFANHIRENQIKELIDSVTDEEINLHNKIVQPNLSVDNVFLVKTCKWLLKLYLENKKKKIYRNDIFAEVLAKRLIKTMRRTKTCSLSTACYILSSPFAPYIKLSPKQKIALMWKITKSGFEAIKVCV